MAWADLTDCRCYYELRGSGDPLLLIPGLGGTCRIWDAIAADLVDSFSLICPDSRGVGRSEARRPAQNLRDYTADLVELLDRLQVDRAHLLGLSLGGVIAQRFAVDHPDRLNRLVLMSCTHRFTPYLREMARLVGETMRRFPRPLFHRTMALLGTGPSYLDDNPQWHAQEWRQQSSRRAMVRQLRCVAADDDAHDGRELTTPTLVIAGEFDVLIPACYARHLADAIPHSWYLPVADAGHNPLMERPRQVIPAIVEFLRTGQLAAPGSGAGQGSDIDQSDPPQRIAMGTA